MFHLEQVHFWQFLSKIVYQNGWEWCWWQNFDIGDIFYRNWPKNYHQKSTILLSNVNTVLSKQYAQVKLSLKLNIK